jgi:DNA-binding response OmpR family regulator
MNNKALVAEYESIDGAYLRLLLEKNGWKADVVKNTSELLSKLDEKEYALVLLNREFCKEGQLATHKIRAVSKSKQIHIVGVTSFTLAEEKRNLINAGVDFCLTKPVYNDKLAYVLGEICEKVTSATVA